MAWRTRPYVKVARGRRDDLGDTFWRSSWEANYARYLNVLKSQGLLTRWEFEPQRFVFYGETRGPISYTPDFRVAFPDGRIEFHEIKGWMDSASRSRIKRMHKHYPDIVLIVIDAKAYRAIEKQFAKEIPEWEYPRPGKKPAPKKKYRKVKTAKKRAA